MRIYVVFNGSLILILLPTKRGHNRLSYLNKLGIIIGKFLLILTKIKTPVLPKKKIKNLVPIKPSFLINVSCHG